MSGHKSFYINTFWQYGLQLIKYVFPLLLMPYLTRVLGPDVYAVYAYVTSFMIITQELVDFGFNLSGTKLIASANDVNEENQTIGAITEARLLLCVVVGIGVFILANLLLITQSNLVYTMLAFLAVCGRALAPDFVFQGHENMQPLTTRYFISKGTSTLLTFILVRSAGDIIWIPVLDILASLIALIWSIVAANRLFGVLFSFVPLKDAVKEFKVSALYCFSNLAAQLFNGFTTLLIGIVITDPAQISYWSIATTAVGAVQALYVPITNSMYPHMIKTSSYSFVRKIALIALPFVLLGTVVFGLLRNIIFLVLGGSDYLGGTWILIYLTPVLFFSFYAMLFGWPVLGAAGKVKEITMTTVFSSLFCVAALLFLSLIGHANMQSICVVRSITELLLCISRIYFARDILFNEGTNSILD